MTQTSQMIPLWQQVICGINYKANTRGLVALPAFQPGAGASGKAAAVRGAPLEPRLAMLRVELTAAAAAQLRSVDELTSALQVSHCWHSLACIASP